MKFHRDRPSDEVRAAKDSPPPGGRPAPVVDPDPHEWDVLLAASQAGDAQAYRTFLHAILPFLRSVARARTRSEELVEDVVQDALLTLHRVRHTYEPGRPVKPWLAAI